jgi:hypothetical protein
VRRDGLRRQFPFIRVREQSDQRGDSEPIRSLVVYVEEIKRMDQDVHEAVVKGTVPKVGLNFLREKEKARFEKLI